jgi:hypothetical protein
MQVATKLSFFPRSSLQGEHLFSLLIFFLQCAILEKQGGQDGQLNFASYICRFREENAY